MVANNFRLNIALSELDRLKRDGKLLTGQFNVVVEAIQNIEFLEEELVKMRERLEISDVIPIDGTPIIDMGIPDAIDKRDKKISLLEESLRIHKELLTSIIYEYQVTEGKEVPSILKARKLI